MFLKDHSKLKLMTIVWLLFLILINFWFVYFGIVAYNNNITRAVEFFRGSKQIRIYIDLLAYCLLFIGSIKYIKVVHNNEPEN